MRLVSPTSLILATLAAVVMTGCEEHVVNERMAPSTGMGDEFGHRSRPVYIQPTSTAPPPKKETGVIEDTGEFLFGWVDDVFKPKPKSSAPVNRTTSHGWNKFYDEYGSD